MTPPAHAVIFDIGGVLVRCGWDAPAARPLLAALGTAPDIFAAFAADGLFARLNAGDLAPADFAREGIRRFNLDLDLDGFRAAWTGIFTAMPGMETLFNEVRERFPVTLLSDTDPWHWAKLASQFPWIGAVKKPILSYEHHAVKPDPALYRAAADVVGVAPSNCIFMDDREENVLGARRAGLMAFRFENAEQAREEIDHLIRN